MFDTLIEELEKIAVALRERDASFEDNYWANLIDRAALNLHGYKILVEETQRTALLETYTTESVRAWLDLNAAGWGDDHWDELAANLEMRLRWAIQELEKCNGVKR